MDCEKVLEGGPWLIHQHYITLRPWTPDFKPSEATTTHVKVWVDLPELPIEYYDKEVLLRIGASIGRPVKIHPITERRERVRFARLCVEVDLKRPFLSQIRLGQLQQQIQYKGHVGHLQQDLSPHTPCPQCQLHAQTKRKSGPYQKGSLGNEFARSGSGFIFFEQETPLDPTAESKPTKGESAATTSYSISFPDHIRMNSSSPDHIGKNSRPNESIERKQHLQPGEGTSSSTMYIETSSTPAEETLTGCSRTPSEPKVPSILCTPTRGNLPHDSFQQTQLTTFVASSQIPNIDLAVNTAFNSNLHQRPKQAAAPPNFSLYSQAMQRATELQDIRSTPDDKMELSTSEDCRMVFRIKRTPVVFNIEPTISNIQIRVSNIPQFSSISLIPTVTNHMTAHQNLKTNPASHAKKLLGWDCGGAGDRKFMQAIKDLIQLHKPSIIVLTDPKTCGADAYGIIKEIGFSADPAGLTHGIWVLWQEEDVDVELTSSAPYQINASVQVFPEACNNPLNGMPYGVYDNFEPFSQPSGPSIFYTSEEFVHAPTSEWVLLGMESEAEQILFQS